MTDQDQQRILVTGALGCLGAWTVKLLADEGTPVIAADKGTDRKRLDLVMGRAAAADIELVENDVTDLAAVEALLDEHRITNVIHLAALQVPFSKANPPLGAAVNVVGTANIFEAVKRRGQGMGPVVYASSIGKYSAADIDPDDGILHEDASVTPISHYGVFKHANEGTARVYAADDGVASVGLRPMVVYGPGRDQGLTSDPARAILAAVVGRGFEIAFGGRILLQYAADVAAAFVIASRSSRGGAAVYNLDGILAPVDEFIAALDRAVPGAAGRISHREAPLGLPGAIETTSLAELGALPMTPLDEAIATSVSLYRERLDADVLDPAEHGLG